MLVVKVELHSARDGRVEELARMIIANDGTGNRSKGNYDVRVGRKGQTDTEIYNKPGRSGQVKDYSRVQLHVWNLVARALTNTGYK